MSEFLDASVLQEMDAESLLNTDITQLKDLEPMVPKPNGIYMFQVEEFEIDTVGADEKTAIKAKFKLLEVAELEDEKTADEVGDLPGSYTELFVLEKTKGFGARKFVTMFRSIAEQNEATTITGIMEAAVGATGAVFIKKRSWKDKDSGELKYNNEIQADTVQWA